VRVEFTRERPFAKSDVFFFCVVTVQWLFETGIEPFYIENKYKG